MKNELYIMILILALLPGSLFSIDKVGFIKKPIVKKVGDSYAIEFELNKECDVTIVVENGQGEILRHIGSGVVGANSPKPFQKNSLRQKLIWDGKDDQKKYLKSLDGVNIRVSLGFKPVYDKRLFWSPYKMITEMHMPLMSATEKGVVVFEGMNLDNVKLFDHEGEYQKTVYPFSSAKVKGIGELHWEENALTKNKYPLKEGHHQSTLLNSGFNAGFDGFGIDKHNNWDSVSAVKNAATALVAHKGELALAAVQLNRLKIEGGVSSHGMKGPETFFMVKSKGKASWGGGGMVKACPSSMAFSPDGKILYLAGYYWDEDHGTAGITKAWIQAVYKIDYSKNGKLTLFKGDPKKAGKTNELFSSPTSVDCDNKGNVYISDYVNNRIQVYGADGSFLKSLPAKNPAKICIHKKTGEIFCFSWIVNNRFQSKKLLKSIKPYFSIFKNYNTAKPSAVIKLPIKKANVDKTLRFGTGYARLLGMRFNAVLDSYAAEPRIWFIPGKVGVNTNRANSGIHIYKVKGKTLELVKKFSEVAKKSVSMLRPPTLYYQRIKTNPVTGMLYVTDASASVGKSFSRVVEVNPKTGQNKIIQLPFDAEDMEFDSKGYVYLRSRHSLLRFDFKTWREVPFDYGVDEKKIGYSDTKNNGPGRRLKDSSFSGIKLEHYRSGHQGGIYINLNGDLMISFRVSPSLAGEEKGKIDKRKRSRNSGKPRLLVNRKMYPGRTLSGLIQIYNKHGQLLNDDAFPGIGYTHGVGMDVDRNMYLMSVATRIEKGKPVSNQATNTFIKAIPGKSKMIAKASKFAPIAISKEDMPKRPVDVWAVFQGGAWLENTEWMIGGVGFNGRHKRTPSVGCNCWSERFSFDYLNRSFLPQVDQYRIKVCDSAGNVITHIGEYGNVDHSKKGSSKIGLFYAPYLASLTDKKLFIADTGNFCIHSVNIEYEVNELVKVLGK